MIQKIRLFGGILMFAMTVVFFTACENEESEKIQIITFEDVNIGTEGFYNGSDLSGTPVSYESWGQLITDYHGAFKTGSLTCYYIYNDIWSSWSGIACSNHTDKDSAGFMNQYSVYANSGANGSEKFGIINTDGARFVFDKVVTLKSIMINNTTYAYKAVKDGNDGGAGFARKFVNNDYFFVRLTGHDSTGIVISSKEVYLADFRDGKSYVCSDWTEVSLEELGNVKAVSFSFISTDTGDWGINTPAYCCIDNIKYVEVK